MTPREYQELAARTECNQEKARLRMSGTHSLPIPRNPTAATTNVRLNHGVIGLMGEVGELAGALEKHVHYGQPFDAANFEEEIGDCLWYIALLCNTIGVDMGLVMEQNIAKLKVRYPEKYSDEAALEQNRNRKAEQEAADEVEYESDDPVQNGWIGSDGRP